MRFKLLAAILALLPMPAFADVTARYSAGKEVLLVEADDGGNSRIGIDGKFSIIRRDGADYVAMTQPTGEIRVAELAELLSMLTAATGEGVPSTPLVDEKFLLESKGEASLGDRKGTLWSFGPQREGADGKPEKMLEILISADPALAPIGGIFHRTVETLSPLLNIIAPASTGFAAKAAELTVKGTPLRIDKLVLQSVDRAEIDSKRFELPAPVVSAIEFMGVLGASRQSSVEIKPLP